MELFRSLTSGYRPCGIRSMEGSTSLRRDSDEAWSVASSSSSSPSSSRRQSFSHYLPEVIPEETPDPSLRRVYVAVGRTKEKAAWLLRWTFRKFPVRDVVLLHVHRPSTTIPTLLGKLPASRANKEAILSHRRAEKEEMKRTVCHYLNICRVAKVRATAIVTEATQEQYGIASLVAKFGIQTLVMGSATDGWLKTNVGLGKAQYAAKNIPLFCEIWFIYKGKHVWTRKATEDFESSYRYLDSDRSTNEENMRSGSLPCPKGMLGSNFNIPHVVWEKAWFWFWFGFDWFWLGSGSSKSEPCINIRSGGYYDPFGTLKPVKQVVERLDSYVLHCSYFSSVSKDEKVVAVSSSPNPASTSDTGEYMIQLFLEKSEEEITEAENSGCEVLSESVRSKGSEPHTDDAEERHLPEGPEDNLRETEMELQKLLNYREEITEELQTALRAIALQGGQEGSSSKLQSESTPRSRSLQLSLSDLRRQINSIKKLRDEAIQTFQLLQDADTSDGSSPSELAEFSEYTLQELQTATCNFTEIFKLGQGGFGCVYKGEICGRIVAVKRFYPEDRYSISKFQQEVKVLSKLRHPNLVILFGACSEPLSIVYEYLPNGNLQHHLFRPSNTTPLPWQLRVQIAAQIASALLFLHSKPDKIVHGDLKPENILLGSDFTCKLGDFSISRFLPQKVTESRMMLQNTEPKASWAYMDPEFRRTGNLTPASDVYAFGVVVLQLITGRPPNGLAKEVRAAAAAGRLEEVIDASVGKWPTASVRRMVELGLRCCRVNRRDRLELSLSVLQELEHMI